MIYSHRQSTVDTLLPFKAEWVDGAITNFHFEQENSNKMVHSGGLVVVVIIKKGIFLIGPVRVCVA